MNILYCGDQNMEQGLILSALSLVKHSQEALHIYILTMSLETQGKHYQAMDIRVTQNLQDYLQQFNHDHEVTLIDLTETFKTHPPVANMSTRFTPYCMLRLYADLVSELPERLLYLDTDVLARQDFSDYYHQDMTGIELVGSLDYYGRWFFRQSWTKVRRDYINSGVLLLNLARIRQTGLFADCRDYCAKHGMFMPDQSALNKLCSTKRILPRRFNEQRKLHKNTVFHHFTTSFRFFPWFKMVAIKPWEVNRVHEELGLHDYDDLYAHHQQLLLNRQPMTMKGQS